MLARDSFGNYVLQRAIEVCSAQQRQLIVQYAHGNLASLRKTTYGKHILQKLDKHAAMSHSRSSRGGGGDRQSGGWSSGHARQGQQHRHLYADSGDVLRYSN